MDSLLSIITFIPAVAAAIMALFLRGDSAAAQGNAKWLALLATVATFLVSLLLLTGCSVVTKEQCQHQRDEVFDGYFH